MTFSAIRRVGLPLFVFCSVAFRAWSADPTPPSPKLSGEHDRGVRIIQSTPPPGADNGGAPTSGPLQPINTAPVGPVNHSILPVCDRPNSTVDIVFRGQPEFDRSLSNALHAAKPVVVDVAEPYDERSPPPPGLEPWLSEVKSAGGAVVLSPYCAGGRGLVQNWFSDFVQHLTRSIYKPAKHYDVTLYADASRRKITQIAFKPKAVSTVARN